MRAFIAALVCAAAISAVVASRSVQREDELPLTKVVNLLKDMQKDIEKSAKEDKDIFESLTCWCKTNEARKTQAVEDAKQKLEELQATIEGASGKQGELGSELEQIDRDIAEATKALAEATALRKKEAAAFHAYELENIQSVELLRGAITALSKHHPAMLQAETDAIRAQLAKMRPGLRKLVHRNLKLIGWLQTSPAKEEFLDFLSAQPDILEPDVSFLQAASTSHMRGAAVLPYKSYAPQSGQIMGVLKQLKEDFEENLPVIQKDESEKQQSFAQLKGSKESEIAGLKESSETKTAELANAMEAMATAKSDRKDVQRSLSADQRFLIEMTERCTEGDYEWERRSKLRAEELAAVTDAIAILSTDAVKDGQQTTFGFLQTRSLHRAAPGTMRRAKAVAALDRLASSPAASPELALIALATRSDPFGKVIKAIDDLAAKLKAEQADEVKHQDFCVSEFDENELETERQNHKLETLEAKIAELESEIKGLTTDIATLKADVADLQVQLQTAGEERQAANLVFQKTLREQRTTRTALKEAYDVLASVFLKRSAQATAKANAEEAALLQQEPEVAKTVDQLGAAEANVAPAPEFEAYKQHEGKNHVLVAIEKLIGETKVVEDGSNHDEQEAQKAYEKLVSDTNDSVEAKIRMIADKSEELAKTKQQKAMTSADRDQTIKDLEALGETKAALHQQCDFLMKNFEARQSARAAEIEGLGTVKAILSGMQGDSRGPA